MPREGTNLVCLLTLQSWDSLVHQIAIGDPRGLGHLCAFPTELVAHLSEICCVFQDAMPVHLGPPTGKVLASFSDIAEESHRRRLNEDPAGKAKIAALNLQHRLFGESQGSSRKQKGRLTLVCRQRTRGLWSLQNGELPSGYILSSVFLVPCKQACRLAGMSLTEPRVWTRDHSVCAGGEKVVRCIGELVGAFAVFLATSPPGTTAFVQRRSPSLRTSREH